jgi:hypothetical protein
MGAASPHIQWMWKTLALTGLVAAFASPAAAQCLSIPDGAGGTALHCSDGRTGFQTTDPGGGTSGMVGGQMLTTPLEPPGMALGQPMVGYVNPQTGLGGAPAPPPSLAPPSITSARPFSTYPDPAGAGMRSQPGEGEGAPSGVIP